MKVNVIHIFFSELPNTLLLACILVDTISICIFRFDGNAYFLRDVTGVNIS
jgi:hypothetical protein